MNKAALLLHETRFPFITASALPAILGTLAAVRDTGRISWIDAIVCLLGVICLHCGANIINDFFDHVTGNDAANKNFVRPFSGGSRMIQNGLLTPREVLLEAVFFFGIAIIAGMLLFVRCGPKVLWLGIIGVLSGVLYTAPRISLVSRGFGELLVGLNFGVLIMLGSYFVQAGHFSMEAALVSIPLGLLVSGILWINEFPDYLADKATGKRTLVVRMGTRTAARGFSSIMAIAALWIPVCTMAGLLSPVYMASLIAVPFAAAAIGRSLKYHENPAALAPGNGQTIFVFNLLAVILILINTGLMAKWPITVAGSVMAAIFLAGLFKDLCVRPKALAPSAA